MASGITNTFSSGINTSFTSQLNANFTDTYMSMYSRNLTTSSTSSSTETTLWSINIPANTFDRILYIDFGFDVYGSCGSSNGSNGVVTLYVNGSSIISVSSQAVDAGSATTNDGKAGGYRIPFRTSLDAVTLTSTTSVELKGYNNIFKGSAVTGSCSLKYVIIEGF